MEFTTLQASFSKALNQVGRVVGTRTTLPVLSNILITAEKGKIKLSATDLEIAITTETVGKVIEEGSLTVPARLLSEFIANNNDVSVGFATKNTSLHLKSEHFEANISGISSEEFPTIPLLPKEQFCSINKDKFVDAIKKVAIATANDETRPVLAGVYFNFNGKLLTLAATDSYRLSEKKISLDESVADKKLIVPARTMMEVLRLLSGSEEIDRVSISSNENQILFEIGGTHVISRLIEGAFPNYSQIIPSSSKIKAEVKHGEFLSAVKMSALFAKNSANNIKIKTGKDAVTVSSMASETGDTMAKVGAIVTGGELEVAFNVRYVLDVLQVLQSDKVTLSLNDDASAGLITDEKDKNFIYIVMPLKIDS